MTHEQIIERHNQWVEARRAAWRRGEPLPDRPAPLPGEPCNGGEPGSVRLVERFAMKLNSWRDPCVHRSMPLANEDGSALEAEVPKHCRTCNGASHTAVFDCSLWQAEVVWLAPEATLEGRTLLSCQACAMHERPA